MQRLIGQKSQILSTPLSFSALIRGDRLQIYEKAFKKWANLQLSLNVHKPKVLQGGLRP